MKPIGQRCGYKSTCLIKAQLHLINLKNTSGTRGTPLEDDMFYRNQKISPNGESLLKWEYYPQYIRDGEFGQTLTWLSMVCPDMPLPLPSSISSRASFLSCKELRRFSAVSRARFQCHGNLESLIKYVCVCVVLEQVLTASHTRLKICSKSSSHERISFLERGPFHLWCFCRRRPRKF